MRKIAVVLAALIATSALASDAEHLEHLRMMMHSMSSHGAVIPQPESIVGLATKTINMTAVTFSFTPSEITVNQGDVVTLNISVPNNDASPVSPAHILLMEMYLEQGVSCKKGQTATVQFVATTPGTFLFVCNQSSCGSGHSSMFGHLVVNAAQAAPAISSISPTSGPVTGGTAVTISGSGFQSGASVTFGGVPAQVISVSNSAITAVTPLGPASEELTVDVVVTNPDGSSATLHPGFNYSPVSLAVNTITPTSGGAGTVVTLTGQGFTTAVKTTVTFGGVEAPDFKIDSPLSMHVTAPPHAAGTVDVAVSVGNSTVVKLGAFTYPAAPPRHRSARH